MNALKSLPLSIHFTGICGTAMGSLAILMKSRGHRVKGSDQGVYPPMNGLLEKHRIEVQTGYDARHLFPDPDLVVIGNALSRGNPEVEAVLSRRLPYVSAAELLREHFIEGRTSLVVSGTHGKTTVTSLLAWVFEQAGKDPGFMIGGIAENFACSSRDGGGTYFITEGDEYDTAFFDKRSKFLHYRPDQLIINNLEFDHADIFDSLEDVEKSFRLLLRLVPKEGRILANGDDPAVARVLETAFSPITRFGTDGGNDLRLCGTEAVEDGTRFEVSQEGWKSADFFIPLHGRHNTYNVLGVLAAARLNGISDEATRKAFESFRSVRRRMERRGEAGGILVYDDFAHHPTAVRETIRAMRELHPERRLLAVFEPRSNTSVLNIHHQEFLDGLSGADRVLLSQPHRLDMIAEERRLDIGTLATELERQGVPTQALIDADAVLECLLENCRSGDVVLVMSNGNFGNLHERLLQALDSPNEHKAEILQQTNP